MYKCKLETAFSWKRACCSCAFHSVTALNFPLVWGYSFVAFFIFLSQVFELLAKNMLFEGNTVVHVVCFCIFTMFHRKVLQEYINLTIYLSTHNTFVGMIVFTFFKPL